MVTWENLKETMIMWFGVGRLDNPFEELKDLHQTSSMEEYISSFELFSPQMWMIARKSVLGYFIGGLRPEVRSRVWTHKPKNKYVAMHLARDVEVEFLVLGGEDKVTSKGKGMGWRWGSPTCLLKTILTRAQNILMKLG